MTRHSTFTMVSGTDPDALIAHIRAEFEAHDLMLTAGEDDALICDTGVGLLSFRPEGAALAIGIAAPSRNELFMLRESVLARLDRYAPGLGEVIEWRGAEFASARPPNFRTARVIGRARLSARFLRLRLEAEDLDDFARSGLHFRLLLPPAGRVPVWPALGPDGRTRWPSGADRLHMPAYTIRRIDPGAGWLDVDVFLHGNGPTCAWAEGVTTGAEVGMTGPGGGWHPDARELVLAGDETALPAIARMLEAAAPEARGTALIEVEDSGDIDDLARPPGVELIWLDRSKGSLGLLEALQQVVTSPGPYVWFAAEKALAACARGYLREGVGLGRGKCHAAAYWSR